MFARRHWTGAAARRFVVAVACASALVALAAGARGEVVQIDAAGYRNVQNLQQLALAMRNYEDARGSLPGQYVQTGGVPGLSWRVMVLPSLGYQSLYDSFNLSKPWNDPANLPLLGQMPDVYRSPADAAGVGVTRYVVGTGPNLIFSGPTGVRSGMITDGTSNTLMLGEAAASIFWTRPDDIAVGAAPLLGGVGFSSITPGYTPFAFADGAVRFLGNDVSSQTLLDLFTRNDGRPIDSAVVHNYVVVPEPAGLAVWGMAAVMLGRGTGRRGQGGLRHRHLAKAAPVSRRSPAAFVPIASASRIRLLASA
jgi:hypothetical protein